MSFQLPPLTKKAEYVLNQFDRIAQNYDLTNDLISLGMHRLWKKAAIDALSLKQGGFYLDVCCGTGDLAMAIAKRLKAKARVIGVDFSQNMLKLAARRAAQQKSLIKVEWIKADAEQLPFADNYFDGAIISFGLRNLSNLDRGLAEIARVVRAPGKVVNLDLGHPHTPIFTPLYHLYFKHLVPIIGHLAAGDRAAYTYLPQSLDSYPKPEEITALFATVGLKNIEYQPLAWGSVALHKGSVV